MKKEILYEDEDILVVNKPAGITVNSSDTTKKDKTLQDIVSEYLHISPKKEYEKKEGYSISEDDFYNRAGIVHRLDKETSGVILVAKNPRAFKNLQEQFKNREVKKTYIALAHGSISPSIGEINVPVGRLPWNRKHFGILAGGREAVTEYEVLEEYVYVKETVSLLRLFPKTGRTHQIRVHLQYIHHPIFSDFLYAGRKTARNDRRYLKRVFLHAESISFTHPRKGDTASFTAPLPCELQSILDTAQKTKILA